MSGSQLTPLGHGGGAAFLEDIAPVEAAVRVAMIVDRSVDGGKFLYVLIALNRVVARSRPRTARAGFRPYC